MSDPASWCYVMVHPAWTKIGMAKIGMTGRDPARREQAVKDALGRCRVRGRRELFRTDVATAKAAIESASCRKMPAPVFRQRYPKRTFRRFRARRRGCLLAAIVMLPVLVWLIGVLLHP
ncbi:MAG TPA: hypothetical protein VKI44_35075 [Acetobacteraceae bacterium]|nr:hypothetical protein [Acetobacteraceae bacterium]